jgi:hypothetical protein
MIEERILEGRMNPSSIFGSAQVGLPDSDNRVLADSGPDGCLVAGTMVFEFQDGKKLFADFARESGIWCGGVQRDGFAQAVKIRRTVGALLDVSLQRTAFRR